MQNPEKQINPFELARERRADLTDAMHEIETALNAISSSIDTFVQSSDVQEQHFKRLATVERPAHQQFDESMASVTQLQSEVSNANDIDINAVRARAQAAADSMYQTDFNQMIIDANNQGLRDAA